jgi:hypothetical protein
VEHDAIPRVARSHRARDDRQPASKHASPRGDRRYGAVARRPRDARCRAGTGRPARGGVLRRAFQLLRAVRPVVL